MTKPLPTGHGGDARMAAMAQPPTLYYDASCGLCSGGRRAFGPGWERRGLRLVPLQDEEARQVLGLAEGELPPEVKLRLPDGRIVGGVGALAYCWRLAWWTWPLAAAYDAPILGRAMRPLYRCVARNRFTLSQACGLRPDQPRRARAAVAPAPHVH